MELKYSYTILLIAFIASVCNCYELLPNPQEADASSQQAQYFGYKLKSQLKIAAEDIARSIHFSVQNVEGLKRLEENLRNAQIGDATSNADTTDAKDIARQALIVEKATAHLISRFCYKNKLSATKCARIIADFNATHANDAALSARCATLATSCTPEELTAKYRALDGGCNHPHAPSLGEAFTAYKRLIHAEYLDGVHSFRRSVNKKFTLPSARLLSNVLVERERLDSAEGHGVHTLAFAAWGEFVERDMARTGRQRMVHFDNDIECCADNGDKLAPRHVHPFCRPIDVPANDAFYADKNVRCLHYVRSMGALRDDCSLGPLDQLNQATHYLDASHIYSPRGGGVLTPLQEANGDLTTPLWATFQREHKRIEKRLRQNFPQLDRRQIFEETRRIVIAEIQHITYAHWLPLVLSKEAMESVLEYKDFNQAVDPSVSNSFATAAIRFAKSLIPASIDFINEDRSVNSSLKLSEFLGNINTFEKDQRIVYLLRGLTTQKGRKMDLKYTQDLLDNDDVSLRTLDVISEDIQRGRDHGLPRYNAYRQLCGLPEADVFDELLDNIPPETVKLMSQVYEDPADIDLIVGGLAETPGKDAMLGDTFACIVADQFKRTRGGDRFFYSFTQQPNAFSERQLEEIKKVTLAKILCNNGMLGSVQKNVFLPIADSNPLVKCEELPDINLKVWDI